MKKNKNIACKIFFLLFMFSFFAGCGPSKEEIEKKKLQEKAKQEIGVTIFKKHQSEADEYMNKLKELKNILTRSDSIVDYNLAMDPCLKAGVSVESTNILVKSFEVITDPNLDAYGEYFDIYFDGSIETALEGYKSLKQNITDIPAFSYLDSAGVEKMASSIDIKVTPYVLIIKQDTAIGIKTDGGKYSGGEATGYAWLADLRTMTILGRTKIFVTPGELTTKLTESDKILQQKAVLSRNENAKKIVITWLKKFKGAVIN